MPSRTGRRCALRDYRVLLRMSGGAVLDRLIAMVRGTI
jgi:hypothetical protein